MWLVALQCSFVLATLIQLGFWLGLFSRLAFYRKEKPPANLAAAPGVSIIICAHNEAENLRNFLPSILQQDYENFEVIVVNDQSVDNSNAILLEFQKNYPILHTIIESNKELPGKKSALSKGILAAKNEILLLTDADCFPNSSYWLSSMVAHFSAETPIVLGYSPYRKENSPLNFFIQYETVYTATQYFSFALAGLPYMGVGRNLAYAKTIFKEQDGFNKHLHIASGDDDLFISQATLRYPAKINMEPLSFVYSIPKESWKSYYYQKCRHLSTASSYRPVHQFLLGLLAWSHLWHYLSGLALLIFCSTCLPLIATGYLVRIGMVSFMYWHIMGKLQRPELRLWTPLLDAGYCLYYLIFAPALIINGSNYKSSWT
ncbi:MAG TPA: glycosyltransferase [Saprospiraceae bacterium]|nr:glycosyltransferase [Saprospiraceae bacterium]